MNGPLVIKIGGSTLGAADTTFRDIAILASDGDIPVVVHGGGAEATRWLEAMDIPSRFENGKRVTDKAALPVIVAVFAGLVNKRIVTALNAAGVRSAGISGADGRLLECEMDDPALGFVGSPVNVHPEVVQALLTGGIVPVISSVGYVPAEGGPDQLVNVNADTVAGNIAAGVNARGVVYLTDVDGVRDGDGLLIPKLSAAAASKLIADGVVTGGMIPKVEACLHALELGQPVQVIDGRIPGALLSREGAGTVFVP